jgi:hypothetical protein
VDLARRRGAPDTIAFYERIEALAREGGAAPLLEASSA